MFLIVSLLSLFPPFNPPKAKAAGWSPAPPKVLLAVFKLFTSVQLVPFHDSVFAVFQGASPPKVKLDVVVP